MKKTIAAASLLFSSFTTAYAAPVVIDFNAESFSNVSSFTTQGVTFSKGVSNLDTSNTPNGTTGIRGSVDFSGPDPFRALIGGGASFVSIDLGDFGSDSDNIFLSVFDAADNLLGTTSQLCCSITEMVTLSLAFEGISYALFGSSGTFNNSVYADNFIYDARVSEVPLPAAVWLFATGLMGFSAVRRRFNLKA